MERLKFNLISFARGTSCAHSHSDTSLSAANMKLAFALILGASSVSAVPLLEKRQAWMLNLLPLPKLAPAQTKTIAGTTKPGSTKARVSYGPIELKPVKVHTQTNIERKLLLTLCGGWRWSRSWTWRRRQIRRRHSYVQSFLLGDT